MVALLNYVEKKALHHCDLRELLYFNLDICNINIFALQ